jgi:serine/threonine protein kinase
MDHIIGKGGFSNVFRATRKSDKQVFAIKRSQVAMDLLDERECNAVLEELRLMKENPHPFIVKINDYFIDNSGHLCIVQELYQEGDFSRHLFERRDKLY